jgi:Mn-dependent DtxR family transcriptional regulator
MHNAPVVSGEPRHNLHQPCAGLHTGPDHPAFAAAKEAASMRLRLLELSAQRRLPRRGRGAKSAAQAMTLPGTRLRYLFSLARLCRENGGARAVEIAAMLGVTRPSVHRMMETLKKQGLIRQSGSLLCLTQQGQSVLEQYQKEYDIFLLFFHHSLGFSLLESEDCAIALLALCPDCRRALADFLQKSEQKETGSSEPAP